MTSLEERIWKVERNANADEKLLIATRTARARLNEEEFEVVEQVGDSIKDMTAQQELTSVLEVLDASFGDIPRLILERYARLVEEEYALLLRGEDV